MERILQQLSLYEVRWRCW